MITVHVPEMTNRADARVVSAAISDVPGVRTLLVDLASSTVRVNGSADPAAVTAAVIATGFAVAPTTSVPAPHHSSQRSTPMLSDTTHTVVGPTTYAVSGMTCSHCERALVQEISAVEGVESVAVDLPAGTVTVTVAQPVDRADIAAAVDEAGYTLAP
jgi:copper chaperone CopZ